MNAQLEPACGAKQCAYCQQILPLTQFSMVPARGRRAARRHSYCKPCRNHRAKISAALGRRKDRKPNRAEVWPRQFCEALLDVRAKKWRGPVSPGPLRWAA